MAKCPWLNFPGPDLSSIGKGSVGAGISFSGPSCASGGPCPPSSSLLVGPVLPVPVEVVDVDVVEVVLELEVVEVTGAPVAGIVELTGALELGVVEVTLLAEPSTVVVVVDSDESASSTKSRPRPAPPRTANKAARAKRNPLSH